MWDGIIGQLGKVIEDAFSEGAPEHENNAAFHSLPASSDLTSASISARDEVMKGRLGNIAGHTKENASGRYFIRVPSLLEVQKEEAKTVREDLCKLPTLDDASAVTKDSQGTDPLSCALEVAPPRNETLLSLNLGSYSVTPVETVTISSESILDKINLLKSEERLSTQSEVTRNLVQTTKNAVRTEVELFSQQPEKHNPSIEVERVSEATCDCSNETLLPTTISKYSDAPRILHENKNDRLFLAEIKCLKVLIENLEDNNKLLCERANDLKKDLKVKTGLLVTAEAKIAGLEKENKSRKIELFQLTNKYLSTSNENVSKLREEKSFLEQEIERLSSELQTAIVEYENRLARMEAEIMEANERANNAEWRFVEKEREAVSSLQNVRRDMESLQELLKDVSKSKLSLEEEYNRLEKENVLLKSQISSEFKSLEDQILKQEIELSELASKNIILESKLKEKEIQHSDCLLKVHEYGKEIENLKVRLLRVNEANSSADEGSESIPRSGVFDTQMSYSFRTLYPAVSVESNEEDKSRLRLENEVIRQSLVIKELKSELSGLQNVNRLYIELKKKHDILLENNPAERKR